MIWILTSFWTFWRAWDSWRNKKYRPVGGIFLPCSQRPARRRDFCVCRAGINAPPDAGINAPTGRGRGYFGFRAELLCPKRQSNQNASGNPSFPGPPLTASSCGEAYPPSVEDVTSTPKVQVQGGQSGCRPGLKPTHVKAEVSLNLDVQGGLPSGSRAVDPASAGLPQSIPSDPPSWEI